MASKHNMNIDKGATFSLILEYKDSASQAIDLSGYTAKMQLRYTNKPLLPLAIELSTENGRITITGNQIQLYIAATDTEQLLLTGIIYDLELYHEDTVIRLVEGNVIVSKEVTI